MVLLYAWCYSMRGVLLCVCLSGHRMRGATLADAAAAVHEAAPHAAWVWDALCVVLPCVFVCQATEHES